jgi:hypothetical protein
MNLVEPNGLKVGCHRAEKATQTLRWTRRTDEVLFTIAKLEITNKRMKQSTCELGKYLRAAGRGI